MGTRLQVKFNATSRDGHPIVNGELVTVAAAHKDGAVRVRDLRGEFKTIDADIVSGDSSYGLMTG